MGAAVAAIIALKEKHLVALFQQENAISPATAKTLGALRIGDDVEFRRLRARTVIREAPAGAYYLDEQSWIALRLARRRRLIGLLIVAAGAAIGIVLVSGRSIGS